MTEDDPLLYGMLMKRRRGGSEAGASAASSSSILARAESSFRQHVGEASQNAWVRENPEEYLRALERALQAVSQHCANHATTGC